ncbi:MAG: response regulator, partial [Litorilinea sp.]
ITEQRAREMSTIAAISAALRTATSRHETLKIVMESLQQLLPFRALAFHTVQDGTLGIPERVQGEWPATTLEQLTHDPDMPRLLEAAFESVTLPKFGDQATHFEGHLLALPLRAQGRLLGVILGHYHLPVHNGNANMPLSTPQTRLLTALADIIAGAIYRAELYEETIIMARQMAEMTTSTPQGLVLLDDSGRIILANPAGQDAIAALAPHAPNGPITRLAERTLHLAEPSIDQPEDARFEVISQGAEPRTFEVFLRPVDTEFAHQSWVLILTDVTAERIEQRHLQEQNRLAAVGQLAAGIAHDFNNSLGVIRLYTDLVQRHADLSERDRTRLQTVFKQIDHATHLIHQILDFSRRSIIQKRIVDLHREVAEILTMLEHTLGKNIDLVFEHDQPPLLVDADKTRLQQAIFNLAVNARDAMPNGGKLYFELRQNSRSAINDARLTDMAPGQWVMLTIADTGHGIEPQHLPQLFEPFFTTKPAGHGTGLGLAQVYGIVKQHDGHITVDTQVGEGTVFTLYFPLQTEAEALETSPQPFIQAISQQHILIVEDDPAGREALRDTLQEFGYRVTTAENGLDALSQIHASQSHFDLILSDLVMPKMSGIQFFHQLRQRNLNIPTIVLTGYPLADGGQELLGAGVVDWLPKPFNADTLLQKIETALAAHRQA